MAQRRAAPMYRPIALPSAGSRALRAYETELVVGRIRDLDFWNDNRDTCWWMLSTNHDVTLDVVKALPEKPWDPAGFRYNPSFSASDLVEYTKLQKIRCGSADGAGDAATRDVYYSGKPDFHFADLERMFADEGYPIDGVYGMPRRLSMMKDVFGQENPNMTWDLYQRHFAGARSPMANPAVANARTIRENPTFQWGDKYNYDVMMLNRAMGAEALAELERLYPGIPFWNWSQYSWSDAVTWNVVMQYWDKPWDMAGLSRNSKVIDWKRLADWPNGLVRAGDAAPADRSRAWDWKGLTANPAVATWRRVRENPDLPWWPESLSLNREVCLWEAISAPPEDWVRAGVRCWKPRAQCYVWSKVRFVSDAERAHLARRWMAAWRIQRRWLAAYYTPETRVWRNRMLWEFSGLQGAVGAAGDSAGATRAVAATS